MHLVIPYASALAEPARLALATLQLPHLERLLGRLTEVPAEAGAGTTGSDAPDEYSLSLPVERVVAALRGWPVEDGRLPFAAALARADGIAVDAEAGAAWGLLTPVCWRVGNNDVTLADPAQLDLGEDESRALHAALRPLFEDLGWTFAWGAPDRWYAAHPSLADTPTASLDRAIGRGVDLWLNHHPALRAVRRLQSEVQMVLYTHPVNDAREARGLAPVNSFWLSGTGPARMAASPLPEGVAIDDRLRAPALADDWAAWAEAWAALDAGPIQALLDASKNDTPAAHDAATAPTLTLCGERTARRFALAPRPWWRALVGPSRRAAAPVLESL